MFISMMAFDTPEEKEKITALFELYAGKMLRVAMSVLHEQADAEDAVQEAFLYAADHLSGIREVKSEKTQAYLMIIAQHKAIDIYRKRHPYVSLDEYENISGTEINTGAFSPTEEAIRQLPAEQRNMFLLHYGAGYDYREIGKMYGKSAAAVQKAVSRAKEKIREYLSKEGL